MDVYAAFSEQLQQVDAGQVSLLDENDGLLLRWTAICDQKCALSPA
jgi:nuclear pore complex protein Nup107